MLQNYRCYRITDVTELIIHDGIIFHGKSCAPEMQKSEEEEWRRVKKKSEEEWRRVVKKCEEEEWRRVKKKSEEEEEWRIKEERVKKSEE